MPDTGGQIDAGPDIVPGVAGTAGSTDIGIVILVAGLSDIQLPFDVSLDIFIFPVKLILDGRFEIKKV